MAQVGDTITRSGWTATLTIAGERGPDYVLQAVFVYGALALVETRHLAKQPADAVILAAVNAMVDAFESTRLMYVWARANLIGVTRTNAPWTVRVDDVVIDVLKRGIILKLSASKAGVTPRTFSYDLRGRTTTLAAVAAEVDPWLAELKRTVAAALVPPTEDDALGRMS